MILWLIPKGCLVKDLVKTPGERNFHHGAMGHRNFDHFRLYLIVNTAKIAFFMDKPV